MIFLLNPTEIFHRITNACSKASNYVAKKMMNIGRSVVNVTTCSNATFSECPPVARRYTWIGAKIASVSTQALPDQKSDRQVDAAMQTDDEWGKYSNYMMSNVSDDPRGHDCLHQRLSTIPEEVAELSSLDEGNAVQEKCINMSNCSGFHIIELELGTI
jgi:hypothetical protein